MNNSNPVHNVTLTLMENVTSKRVIRNSGVSHILCFTGNRRRDWSFENANDNPSLILHPLVNFSTLSTHLNLIMNAQNNPRECFLSIEHGITFVPAEETGIKTFPLYSTRSFGFNSMDQYGVSTKRPRHDFIQVNFNL